MLKKVCLYVDLLTVMSITSVGALTVNYNCQSTVKPVEAQFTANCALKTLSAKAKYTGSSDRYTYITRIIEGSNGVTLASCGVDAGKKNNTCTFSSQYYYYSHPHTHNYSRYSN